MDPIELAALPPDVRQRFEAMRREFLQGLGARMHEVQQAPDMAARARVLHRLAGAAGSYGFGALSELAKRAEMLNEDGREIEAADCLDQLLRAIEATRAAVP